MSILCRARSSSITELEIGRTTRLNKSVWENKTVFELFLEGIFVKNYSSLAMRPSVKLGGSISSVFESESLS